MNVSKAAIFSLVFCVLVLLFSSMFMKANAEEQWEIVHENILMSEYDSGMFLDYLRIAITPNKEVYRSWDDRGNVFHSVEAERGVHYWRQVGSGRDTFEVNLGNYGSYDTRLYEHKIINKGNRDIYIDFTNLVDEPIYSNPKNYPDPLWYDSGKTVYDAIKRGTERIIPAQNGKINLKMYRYNTKDDRIETTIDVHRRYVAEEPIVQSINDYTIIGDAIKVQANIQKVGVPNLLNYGHVWSTSPNNLTTELITKTELGEREKTGKYTSTLTDLQPDTVYYVRPYLEHALGTFYGDIQTVRLNSKPEIKLK